MKQEFICSQCGETKKPDEDSCSTGYGTDKDGNKVCFACCGINDAKELESLNVGEKFILYMSKNELTNWPGSFKIPLHYIKTGYHNMAGKRYDAWFNYQGNGYHAVKYGDMTEIAHIKRLKNPN